MATIEIRDILDENGKTIFPRTHVDAIIGLKDISFFELAPDAQDPTKFSVRLKPEYTGLWADGWIAAGGVGTGGGGGGGAVSVVKGLYDLDNNPSLSEDLTVAYSAYAVQSIYDNSGASLSLTSVTETGYLKDSLGNFLLDSNGNRLALPDEYSSVTRLNLINGRGDVISYVDLDIDLSTYAQKSWVSQNYQPTIPDLTTIRDNAAAGAAKVSNVQSDWDATTGLAVILNKPDLSVYALQSNLLSLSNRVETIEDWFELVSVGGSYAIHLKNGYAFYSDTWVAAGGVGSGGGGGVSSFYDLPEIGISPGATIGTFQILTYNGTAWVNEDLRVSVSNTIADNTPGYTRVATITVNGVPYNINAPADGGGGGGGGTEVDPVFTNSAAYGITSSDITAWNGKVSSIMMNGNAVPMLNGVVNLGTVLTSVPDISNTYVTLTGAQSITGAKTFSSNLSVNAEVVVNSISSIIQDTTNHSALFNYGGRLTSAFNAYGTTINLRAFNASEQANILSVQTDRITVGSQLIPNYQTGINLGGSSANQRWSTIYGLNADLTGNLKMESTSHIDIGPVRIEYDSVNKAIHIKKADANDTNEYGFYCDGFVAAGGVQASS